MDVRYFTPTESEMQLYQRVYDNLTTEMVKRYQEQSESIKAYNRRKIENWERIQMEQLIATYIHIQCNAIRILNQSYVLPPFLVHDDFGIGTVIPILTDQKIVLISCEAITSVAVFLTNLITKINSVIVPEFNFLSTGK